MKFSTVWILAICHNFTAIKGYNIDIGNTNFMFFYKFYRTTLVLLYNPSSTVQP